MPANTAGNPQSLSEALKKRQWKSLTYSINSNPYDPISDFEICKKKENIFFKEIKKLKFLIKLIFSEGCIFYHYGRFLFFPIEGNKRQNPVQLVAYNLYLILMGIVEACILILSKKQVYIIFQGDDARQAGLKNKISKINNQYYKGWYDEIKKVFIGIISILQIQVFYLNPDLQHYLPKRAKFLPYAPFQLKFSKPRKSFRKKKIVILHAPTNPAAKGTKIILETFKKFKTSSLTLDYYNCKNKQTYLNRLKNADFFLDQVLVGWYGVSSVEAMALGVPVICYVNQEDLNVVPKSMRSELPIISVTSENLLDCLYKLEKMSSRSYSKISKKSVDFVKKWHNPDKIIKQIVK